MNEKKSGSGLFRRGPWERPFDVLKAFGSQEHLQAYLAW